MKSIFLIPLLAMTFSLPAYAALIDDCAQDINLVVQAELKKITSEPVEDPAEYYQAQMNAESVCINEASQILGANTLQSYEDAPYGMCAESGTGPLTTSQANRCSLEVLSALIRSRL